MKILFVTTVAITHEMFLSPYARHFRAKGWTVDGAAAAISASHECSESYNHTYEVPWSRSPFNPRRFSAAASRIRFVAESGRYDIVHVHTPIAAFITRYALKSLRAQLGVRVIYTAHGFHFYPCGNPLLNRIFLALEKRAGRWTDNLIVINRPDLAAVLKHGIVNQEDVVLFPGIGVDRSYYDPDKISLADVQNFRASIGLDDHTPLFTMVAEFNPGKRHEDALAALQNIPPAAHMAFAGVGPLLERTKKLAERMRLDGRVHFLGYRKDVPVLLRSSVAAVLPSIREGLPRGVMESMSLGIPVIGADTRGIHDLLETGGGILVPPRSPKDLAMAMNWVLDHRDGAEAMGREGREKMAEYDLSHVIRLHEELYEGRLSGRPSPSTEK